MRSSLDCARVPAVPAASHLLLSIISFLLQSSPRKGCHYPHFLEHLLCEELSFWRVLYFPPSVSGFVSKLVFIFSCTNCYFSTLIPGRRPPSTHPLAVFSLVGTFFSIFYSELRVRLIFAPSLNSPSDPIPPRLRPSVVASHFSFYPSPRKVVFRAFSPSAAQKGFLGG